MKASKDRRAFPKPEFSKLILFSKRCEKAGRRLDGSKFRGSQEVWSRERIARGFLFVWGFFCRIDLPPPLMDQAGLRLLPCPCPGTRIRRAYSYLRPKIKVMWKVCGGAFLPVVWRNIGMSMCFLLWDWEWHIAPKPVFFLKMTLGLWSLPRPFAEFPNDSNLWWTWKSNFMIYHCPTAT